MASGQHPASVPDWNNLQILHKNTLPARAYFHNYTSEADALKSDIIKSTTHSLSGTWKFQHSYSPFEAPEGFESTAFDTSSWSDIAVPGMWQLQGFGKGPQYTNVIYHIPVDPPNVPFTENETGSYVRKFQVPQGLKDGQIRLRFEGVDSAFHVWVNGKEVGYSQGSRNPDEFDVTSFVDLNGDNTLAVRVYQHCDGTYIEDQDQWWLSGIFRDVSLVGFPKVTRIENVFAQTLLDSSYTDAELKLKITATGSGKLNVKLLDAKKQVVGSSEADIKDGSETQLSIQVKGPLKWTAESPNLYHLVVSTADQTVHQRVGFRQVEMKDGLIKVNGKRVVFRGVNRHEHHPTFGRAVPYDFMKEDLLTMKRHNINAIRTSHQLNDPRLYDLADEMGFWVIDEADMECHGFESIADAALGKEQRALPFRERQLLTRLKAAEWTTNNKDWTHAYVDRAEALVKRDQLHPSVIIWSLGNEAFMGRNFVAMYEHIKAYDDSRPIHYEADIYADTMDMYSRMYPPIDEIIKFAEDKEKKKPLILCEYIHAMGNGPGNIKEYIDAFYKYPVLQGGFAWEWANHGLLTKDKKTGEEFYAYGGDFGEEVHDSTFVMDGLVDSDHKPNAGLIEYKKAIEPVQLLDSGASKAKFINRYDFITLDHLVCNYTTTSASGSGAGSGSLDIPSGILPGQTFELQLPKIEGSEGEVLLNMSFQLKDATPYLKAGFEIATAQLPVTSVSPLQRPDATGKQIKVETESKNIIKITTEKATWKFNTLHGSLTSWVQGSTELISKAPEFDIFRAPTDNDIPQDGWDWNDKHLQHAKPATRKVEWSQSGSEALKVIVHQRMAPPVLSWSIDTTLTYTFSASGTLSVHVAGSPKGENLPRTLPRIGLVMELPKQFQKVEWFGRGFGESYRDSKFSQPVGKYTASTIDELWVDYEVPQESANHTDTRYLSLTNGSGAGLLAQFAGKGDGERKLFDFQVSHYHMKDVAAAAHPHDYPASEIFAAHQEIFTTTYSLLDLFQAHDMTGRAKKRRKSRSPDRAEAAKRTRLPSTTSVKNALFPQKQDCPTLEPTSDDWVFHVKVISSTKEVDEEVFKNAVQGLARICFPEGILDRLGEQRISAMVAEHLDTPAKVTSTVQATITASARAHTESLGGNILDDVAASILRLKERAPDNSTEWLANGDTFLDASSGDESMNSKIFSIDDTPSPPPTKRKKKKKSERTQERLKSVVDGELDDSQIDVDQHKTQAVNKLPNSKQWDLDPDAVADEAIAEAFPRTADLFAYHAIPITKRKLGPDATKKEFRLDMQSMLEGMPKDEFEKNPQGEPQQARVRNSIVQAENALRRLSTEDRDFGSRVISVDTTREGDAGASQNTENADSAFGMPVLQLLWGTDSLTPEQCVNDAVYIIQTIMRNLQCRVSAERIVASGLGGKNKTWAKSNLQNAIVHTFPKLVHYFSFMRIKKDIEASLVPWVIAEPSAFPDLKAMPFVFAHTVPSVPATLNLLFGSWPVVSMLNELQMWEHILRAVQRRGISEVHPAPAASIQVTI
ncbi:vanillyl alcohol oxidase [Stemphylium lycopersici]|nr:vanillyl alcohol oxidase [Stemphylium lycopersici]